MDYDKLVALRRSHPAWRLLLASHAPLVASFLHEVFIAPNARTFSQSALRSKLEDTLFRLRELDGADAFPRGVRALARGRARTRALPGPPGDLPRGSSAAVTETGRSEWIDAYRHWRARR